ncbi:hypothetical protein [Pseudomonas sp. E102]|uniref:hypothetical protein n=1 Tax=Pseudomonas sp. E102 TaxID=181579 RepID=UPI0040467635
MLNLLSSNVFDHPRQESAQSCHGDRQQTTTSGNFVAKLNPAQWPLSDLDYTLVALIRTIAMIPSVFSQTLMSSGYERGTDHIVHNFTGMLLAAVGRVTEKLIVCTFVYSINFGLGSGGKLVLETDHLP